MAREAAEPGIGLPDRSVFSFRSDEKFSRWLLFSFLFHASLIGAIFLFPLLPKQNAPEYPVYTVDLVGGEKIGRTNFGTDIAPAGQPKQAEKKEPAVPVEAPKREAKKEKTESKPKVKTAEPPPAPDKLAMKDVTKKEQPTKQPANK